MSGILDALEIPEDVELPQPVVAILNQRLLWIAKRLSDLAAVDTSSAATAQPSILVGTRAQRTALASNQAGRQAIGTEFYETDTALTYIVRPMSATSTLLAWHYFSGNQRGTFANLPAPGGSDAGLLYTITDKNRTLRWTGSAWEFAPWETIPVGYMAGFRTNPGTGWHICDGSGAVNQLNADGTITVITVEDFGTARYPKWGPTAAGAGAAVAPLITGNTADAPTGITVSAAAAAAAATAATASINNPAAGTPTTVLVPPFTGGGGGGGGGAVTDPQHHHAHGTLVNDALGEPLHYGLVAYQRI